MFIIAQTTEDGTLDNAVNNISIGLPYVTVFGLVVALVRIIVKRSEAAEQTAKEHTASAEARMIAEIERNSRETKESCRLHTESIKRDYEAHILEVKSKLEIMQRGMDILAAQYPDNETLKFMLSSIKIELER